MADNSMQDRVGRVRPPRVHITYEVQTGGSEPDKEIPFVMGVLADLSGDSEEPLPSVDERDFAELDPDTFKNIFSKAKPRLQLTVNNVIGSAASEKKFPGSGETSLTGIMNFKSLDDFDPKQVASQISPLKELLELREALVEMQGHLQTNRKLDYALLDILNNPNTQERWRNQRDSSSVSVETRNP